MERMKPHALESGTTDGMMLRTRDGETVWEVADDLATDLTLDELTDVDTTTTPPTVGQTLLFDDASGQWVPGTIPGTEEEPLLVTVPTVDESVVEHHAAGPYDVTMPGGIDDTFDGKFVVILNWLSTPATTITDLLALGDWELLAYTGEWGPGSTPFTAVLGGDPVDNISIDAGSGACEVTFLAVKDAVGFRNLPLPATGPVLVDNCNSATNWTSPTATPVTVASGAVIGSAVHNDVNPAPGSGGFLHKTAVLDRNVAINFYTHPILVVEWMPPHANSRLVMQTRGDKYPFLEYPTYYTLGDGGGPAGEDAGGGYRRSIFRFVEGNENAAEKLALRFIADSAEAGEELKIRNIESRPSPHANHQLGLQVHQVFGPSSGTRAEKDDLLVVVGVSTQANKAIDDNMGGGVTEVAASNPGNPSLTSRTYTQRVVVAGRKYPGVYNLSEFGANDLGIATIAIEGFSEAAPPVGGASELGDLTDVDTTTDAPEVGQALVFNGTEWVPGSAAGGMTAEEIRDLVAATLVAGTNVTLTVDDPGNTITIAAADTTDPEVVRDTIGALLDAGTGISLTYDDATDSLVIAVTGGGGLDAEGVRDVMGATLVAGTNVTLTVNDAGDTITINASGGGGGASDLDDLTDVDVTTVAPTDGEVLVFHSASGLWKPGKGGPAVGAWENNLETVFVYPAHVEHDLQSAPPVLPTARPAVANFEVTVTSGMLVTNTGADLGHDTLMQIMLSARVVGTGAGNPSVEAAIWKASTGVETTAVSAQIGAPASGNRVYASILSPLPIEVGDKVRIRMWSANGANYRVDWWAHRSVPTRIGKKVDAGRVGLFRDVSVTGNVGIITPTTVLTNAPTAWAAAGSDLTRGQYLDNAALTNQNTTPPTTRTLLADPAGVLGFLTISDGVNGTSLNVIATSTVSAFIHPINNPTQVKADRLYVPAPPT